MPAAVLVGVLTGVACGAVTGLLITAGKLAALHRYPGHDGHGCGNGPGLDPARRHLLGFARLHLPGRRAPSAFCPCRRPLPRSFSSWPGLCLYQTDFGRYIISIGGNEAGTRLSGVNTAWWKFLTYVVAGALAALGGVIMAARLHAADPIVGNGWEFDAIAATILGGTSFEKGNGSLGGTVLGVLLIAVLRNGLNVIGVGAMWQPALIGLVIIAAIVFDVLLKQRGVIQ